MNSNKRLVAYLLTMLALASLSGAVHAEPWDDAGQAVQDAMYGPIGTTLAILGVAGLGVAAFFGKMAWDRAGMVIVGIVIFFAAPAIVGFFKGRLNASVTPPAIYAVADIPVSQLPRGLA